MAETYKKIFPGNWVERISAYPLPNADFKKNNRPSGDPHDRQQQGVLYMPGVIAVHKVAFCHIEGAVPPVPGTGAGIVGYDLTVGSPDTRGDDKPRADIKGLIVPSGAYIYRCGFRVPRLSAQPGSFSSGAKDAVAGETSGLKANAAAQLWLEAKAGGATAVPADAGAITATGAHTGTIKVTANGEFEADEFSNGLLTPVATTAELEFKLYADKGGLGSSFLGGLYLVAEVCYLVEDHVADLESIALNGARYSGYTG
jgi:hypothetical protein